MVSLEKSQRIIAGAGNGTTGMGVLPGLLDLTLEHPRQSEFLNAATSLINQSTGATATAIVHGVKGTWRVMAASSGDAPQLPRELLADVLDRESTAREGSWVACPLQRPARDGMLLLQNNSSAEIDSVLDSIAAALDLVLTTQVVSGGHARRAKRLEAILEATAHWNQSREIDQLLIDIAEAATRLLNAERATIFLPDPSSGEMVGRPALGVEGGELRIDPGTGVVGQVMESGEAHRVDSDIAGEQAQINREVDKQLDFETRSLVCVPMTGTSGVTIGAFELINSREGNFTENDTDELAELAAHAAVAIENTKHVEHLVETRRNVAEQAAGQVNLIGDCPQIEALKSTIERVAATELPILILGENGTGKEVVAQMIHYLSDRRDQVLVAVNCAAITETLLESELFGHEKGAFTDAHQTREGKFELADEGSLFLDEIGDMSPGGQAKLLRVLQQKVITRVGGSTPITTNARVIAATNQDLPALISEKKFREDLFFRLNVVTIELPALRERGDDIILLAKHFIEEFCTKARRKPLVLSAAARKRLVAHEWPGNVRELRNMMERLSYLFQGDKVDADDLEFILSQKKKGGGAEMDLSLTLAESTRKFQCEFIQKQIDRAGGNMTDAARRMGLHRSNLYRKMRQLEMVGDDDLVDEDPID
ncbi:MAG: sigma-54-dependent Fis family transcriptional regulator [Planctomycetota bacterium]